MEIVSILLAVFIGVVGGYVFNNYVNKKKGKDAEETSRRMIEDSKKEASNIIADAQLEAKEIIFTAKSQSDSEAKERLREVSAIEKRIHQREEMFDNKLALLDKREQEIKKSEQSLADRARHVDNVKAEVESLKKQEIAKLEEISGMDSKQAKKELMQSLESEARHEAAKLLKQITDEAEAEADKKAKSILSTAIQRYAADVVSSRTVSVVNLPSEEMKGRIIGREGRNIRAIEAVTGVDLIIDDTPDAVILSSFDPIKREIARLSLETLVIDGRIHPSRIEEVVEKVTKEVNDGIWEAGQQATFDVGVHGISPELIKLVGKLKYRTSFSQNVYQHSLEVAHLCGIIAAELGVNQKIAKRIGLLHDIGKAMDHEVEGSHAIIGAEVAKRHGEAPKVIDAISSHHNEAPVNSVYGFLVQAADSLSAARPGARREMLENYIKRLEDLEAIANALDGVSKAYAVQAGREIRVMVDVDKINDEEADLLAKQLTKDIELKLTYPGQIRVVVIRETRAVRYAK
ncbi:MAG TPA: ribonuclease Y [Deltaproteobacteria bacterium]|mgnify:CR=1 FL=1|nr:ribonuclease Y [Deltaproteobacteria bacterium]